MLIISDTNILSSLAACDSLLLIFELFPNHAIQIPPSVQQEIQAGLARNRTYLQTVLDAIVQNRLRVLGLSDSEQQLTQQLPTKLNTGEREAIAHTQSYQAHLLSNDKRAVRYCQQQRIKVVDLADLLRLFWTNKIISRSEVEQLIVKMEQVENLILSEPDRAKIFASLSRSQHRRRKP